MALTGKEHRAANGGSKGSSSDLLALARTRQSLPFFLFAQNGFGPRSYLSNAIQGPGAIERPLRVIRQVIVSEFCCKGRETAGLFEFRRERYLVLTKKIEKRRKVVRGSICNRPQGKNSFQHLLYCLLGIGSRSPRPATPGRERASPV